MPELILKRTSPTSYHAETPSGAVNFGGSNASPMDTVAASLAGCLAMSISQTLGVMRQKLDDIEIRLSFEKKEEEPKIFEYFNIHLILRGEALSPAKVEKALHMAEETYCQVSVILGLSGAQMRSTFAIENKKIG
jgi:putative redox protein